MFNNDITGAGSFLTISAPLQFQPLIKIDLSDDTDPFTEEKEAIAVAGVSLSFKPYSYKQAKPRYINIACMPNTISAGQLLSSYNLLINPLTPIPRGGVTITAVYPSLGTVVAVGCSWIDGDTMQSIQSSGRLKTLNFKFNVGMINVTPPLPFI